MLQSVSPQSHHRKRGSSHLLDSFDLPPNLIKRQKLPRTNQGSATDESPLLSSFGSEPPSQQPPAYNPPPHQDPVQIIRPPFISPPSSSKTIPFERVQRLLAFNPRQSECYNIDGHVLKHRNAYNFANLLPSPPSQPTWTQRSSEDSNTPLVLIMVGQNGDDHVHMTEAILRHYTTISSNSQASSTSTFPLHNNNNNNNSNSSSNSHTQISPPHSRPHHDNKVSSLKSVFESATFAVVTYHPDVRSIVGSGGDHLMLDGASTFLSRPLASVPANGISDPYDIPLLIDTCATLARVVGALHPLGGGRYPLDSIVIVDGKNRKRAFIPISTYQRMGSAAITSAHELEQVLVESLTYLAMEGNEE